MADSLRNPTQLLHAFGKAAARFPECPRMVAFLNSARQDGLVTIPSSFVPRKADGQPIVGQLNIGGTGKATFGQNATFYGIGGAGIASESSNLNVGFILYGAGADEAVTAFRELGNEAGAVVHVNDLICGIQQYDSPLVLWSLIVYDTLQGSTWLSQVAGITEDPALHFNPFAASVETLKRLLARKESLVERLLTGPNDVELTPRELALLEAHLKQPVSPSQTQWEEQTTDESETNAKRNKLKLIRDFNRNLRATTQAITDADQATDLNDVADNRQVVANPEAMRAQTTGRGGDKADAENDDSLPKSKRAGSPSRIRARSAYDYAMERIPHAYAMTAPELFDAIKEDGEAASMLPPTAESFTRYLNDCGIRFKKGGPRAAGGSVVRQSDL